MPSSGGSAPLHVLALGAHCDDIEIGAGGTLLEWAAQGASLAVHWVVFTSTPEREREATAAARAFLCGTVEAQISILRFRDGFLPYEGAAVKEAFELLKVLSPDVILTHARDDRHQDHRIISDLTWNTFRDHMVLEYEVPKYDGDLGQPNCFVSVSPELVARKWEYLRHHYPSQVDHHWFSEDTFRGLMRLRGIEARAESGFAEAFTARKLALGTPVRSGDPLSPIPPPRGSEPAE